MSPVGVDAYQVFWAVIVLGLRRAAPSTCISGIPRCAWARAASRGVRRRSAIAPPPAVSVIVVAHDEADRICARIDNLLAQDYPRDRLEILIASDGSTDGTASLARAYARDGVAVIAFAARRGKARRAERRVVPRASGAHRRARGRPRSASSRTPSAP